MKLLERLSATVEIAREAGALARKMRNAGLDVQTKGKQDFVTEADVAVENLIRNRIAASFGPEPVLGEEGGMSGSGDALWVIDPIDGTTNYMRGLPDWAVSIAWCDGGDFTIGVIFAPDLDVMAEAIIGSQPIARINGAPVSVGERRSAETALIQVGWSPRTEFAEHAQFLDRLIASGADYRRSGAATIGLLGVACGQVDAYIERSLNLWDAAAGIALIRAAGGVVNAPHFSPQLQGPAPFLAISSDEHELASLLRDAVES